MNPDNNSGNANKGKLSLRLLRPSIVVLCGPAACGKSTFAQHHFRPTQIISSDWARALICDDDRDQRFNAQAFALVNFLVEQRVTVNRLCVVDSTALTDPARKELVELAKKYQVPSTLIIFNVPLETCIARDQKRKRSVGSVIIERQFQTFEQSKEAVRHEEFDQVVEFQDGDLDKVQIEILFRPVTRPVVRPQRREPTDNRRFERPGQTTRTRPSGPSDNGRSHVNTPFPAVAHPPARTQPETHSSPAAVVATGQTGVAPAPTPTAKPAMPAPSPAFANAAKKPPLPPQVTVSPKATPASAPRPVPVGVQSSGAS